MLGRNSHYSRSAKAAALWCALALTGGCTFNNNGSTVANHRVGDSVSFSGYALVAGAKMEIQILRDAALDPTKEIDPASGLFNWITIGTVFASTTPMTSSAGDRYYSWAATVTPVPLFPTILERRRWPDGGLARFRVLQNGSLAATFDNANCAYLELQAGSSALEISRQCGSHDPGILTFVDGTPVSPPLPPGTQYLSKKQRPDTNRTEAFQYASATDARNRPPSAPQGWATENTLDVWKANRGFPGGAVNARYYNRGDLGIGRNMSCRKFDRNNDLIRESTACFVSNYGSVNDGLDDRSSALTDAVNGHGPFATVAMDYDPYDPGNRVKFYVFNGSGARLRDAAALDREGNKLLPNLCTSCHGGLHNTAQDKIANAKFLPFDLKVFDFESSGSYTRASQEEAFRQLNDMVYDTDATPAIRELIDGWYGGQRETPGTTQNNFFVMSGWDIPATLPDGTVRRGKSKEQLLYDEVLAPYCRSCHFALTGALAFQSFSDFEGFGTTILHDVCVTRVMPHAERTREDFWNSPARAHLVAGLRDAPPPPFFDPACN